MNPGYEAVALRAGHRCEYCRAPEAVFNFPFEVEYIIPLVHAGAARRKTRRWLAEPVMWGKVRISSP